MSIKLNDLIRKIVIVISVLVRDNTEL